MRTTIPRNWVCAQFQFSVRSSSGLGFYLVSVIPPDSMICVCPGYRNHGHCRHARLGYRWLEAVIAPRSLPE